MVFIKYEHEFLRLIHYAKSMFQIEKEMCDKFKWGLRYEIRTLVATLSYTTLVAVTANVHNMESIFKYRSNNFEEKSKEEDQVPRIHKVLEKPKDHTFSASRKDSQTTNFKRKGYSRPTASIVRSSGSKVVRSAL